MKWHCGLMLSVALQPVCLPVFRLVCVYVVLSVCLLVCLFCWAPVCQSVRPTGQVTCSVFRATTPKSLSITLVLPAQQTNKCPPSVGLDTRELQRHNREVKARGEVELTSLTFPAVTGITATLVHYDYCWLLCCDVTTVKRLLVWFSRNWGWYYLHPKAFW